MVAVGSPYEIVRRPAAGGTLSPDNYHYRHSARAERLCSLTLVHALWESVKSVDDGVYHFEGIVIPAKLDRSKRVRRA